MQLIGVTPAAAARFGSSAVTACIQAASSIADSYLASQFTLPLQTSPQGWDMSLTRAVCHIAAYFLYAEYGFNPSSANADQMVKARYDNAIGWLEQIRDEKIFPQWTDSSSSTPAAGDYIVSDEPVGFTDRGLDSTTIDPWWY